jgi:hypothetical protein
VGKSAGNEAKAGAGNNITNKSAIKTPAPKGTTEHTTKSGSAVRTRANGKVSDVHDAKRNMDIHHGLDGSRKVVVTRKDGSRVVAARGRAGYVERGYHYGGHDFARRSYYYHGAYYDRYYRGYYYGGVYMNVYAPAYYYGPAYYGWAYNPWPAPINYGWGWGGNPWYGYYGGYFAPYPAYPSAAFWLADYLIAANLEAAYAARAAADVSVAPSQPWTDAGMQVAEGKSYDITADGVVQFSHDLSALAAPDGRNDIDGGACHHGQSHAGYPAPELPCLSLIGKIGRNGVPFEVGKGRTLIASTSGELYLGVNDDSLANDSGGWMVHVSGADKSANVALTPATKQLVSDEVKSVLALENAEAQQTQQKQDVDPASSGITRLIADVKAGHAHVFVVGDSVDVTGADGTECSVSDGDVLQMSAAPADGATSASVAVLASKGGKECAISTSVNAEVSDLQDMQNHLRESVDQGLEELQKKQGKGGLPTAPPSAQGKPTQTEFAAAAPKPDPKDQADIEAQNKEADKAEGEVVAEAGTGQSPASPVGAVTPSTSAEPAPAIALGQTEDQVKAALGNPTKEANLGAKKIFYYDGMKVIFKDGKVSDVQ